MRAIITILSVAAALVLHLSGVCHCADVTLEQHAASEFAKYVEQITGAEVPTTPEGVCQLQTPDSSVDSTAEHLTQTGAYNRGLEDPKTEREEADGDIDHQ